MSTLDLRLQIAQQIESIPDSEQTLLKVLHYLHRVKGEKTTVVLTGDALRLWNRTVELAALPRAWDGADAAPMEKKAVDNVQKLLKAGVNSDFTNWVLFPDESGTLLLQSKDGNASISIGNHSYSYVYVKGGQILQGHKARFSPTSVLNVIREIAA